VLTVLNGLICLTFALTRLTPAVMHVLAQHLDRPCVRCGGVGEVCEALRAPLPRARVVAKRRWATLRDWFYVQDT